jgi:hypothetical protein
MRGGGDRDDDTPGSTPRHSFSAKSHQGVDSMPPTPSMRGPNTFDRYAKRKESARFKAGCARQSRRARRTFNVCGLLPAVIFSLSCCWFCFKLTIPLVVAFGRMPSGVERA